MPASKSLTPAERTLRARKAAHARWSKHNSHEHAEKMRAGLEQRFLDESTPTESFPRTSGTAAPSTPAKRSTPTSPIGAPERAA